MLKSIQTTHFFLFLLSSKIEGTIQAISLWSDSHIQSYVKDPRKLTSDSSLFASNLGVEAAEADGKRLKSRDRILIIHGEDILPNFPKLENNILMLLLLLATSIFDGCNELEVFHRGNCYAAIEVEAPALELVVPSRTLVFQYEPLDFRC